MLKLLIIFALLTMTVCRSTYLKCYVGTTIEKSIEICRGSCLTVEHEGTSYYCSPLKVPNHCDQYADAKGCFCNTSLCNDKETDDLAY